MPRDTIGNTRTNALGRLGVLVYLATIGGAVVVPVFILLAAIHFVVDWLSSFVLDRRSNLGRTVGTAPLRHHIKLFKYSVFGEEWPGYVPRAQHASTAA